MEDSEAPPMACAASTRLSPKNPVDASLWVLKKDVILYCCKEKMQLD
jgi:hypothetical protein